MSFFVIGTSLVLSATLALQSPDIPPAYRTDSLATLDTTQVLLTDEGIARLKTFWDVLLQEPYNRWVLLASKTVVHANTYYQSTPKKLTRYFINLPLAAAYLKSLKPALAKSQLTVPQVHTLLWSWQNAFAKMNGDAFARKHVKDSIYVPEHAADTALIMWRNVTFVRTRGGLTTKTNGTRLRPPINLEGISDTSSDYIGLLDIFELGAMADSPPPDTLPVVDTTLLACEKGHPCDLQMSVWQMQPVPVSDGKGGTQPGFMTKAWPNAHICVKDTKNCAVSDSAGNAKLMNLAPGEVTLTVEGDGITSQVVKKMILYRHQVSAGNILVTSK